MSINRPAHSQSETLRIAFATGTEPGKWFERYQENRALGQLETCDADDAFAMLLEGRVDAALTRLPVKGADERITEDFHLVRLYEETVGVAVPKDHVLAELAGIEKGDAAVDPAELQDEILNYRIPDTGLVDVQAVREALQIVGANVGIVIAPRPLLKVLSKRQVVPLALAQPSRAADGAVIPEPEVSPNAAKIMSPTARTYIALVWRKERDGEDIQAFAGITRGRTSNSSRGDKKKLSAREKSLAKLARRQATEKEGEKSHKSGKSGARAAKKQSLPKRKQGSGRGKRR